MHLIMDAASDDVTWGKLQAIIVLIHEAVAVQVEQSAPFPSNSLGDEEGLAQLPCVEARGMELHHPTGRSMLH